MTDMRWPGQELAPEIDLRDPVLFTNRELSWLEFNRRVLHEAVDPRTPLLEQLKFIGICSSNLDEFFQVRVAGLRQQVAAGYTERTADGMTPGEQLEAISRVVHDLQRQQLEHLQGRLLPALATHGVRLITDLSELSSRERSYTDQYFRRKVFPVLTPLAVDPAHPFPYISNLSLSIAVTLRGPNGEERFARVKPDRDPSPRPVSRNRDSVVASLPDHPEYRPSNRPRRGGGSPELDSGGSSEPTLRGGGPDRGGAIDAGIPAHLAAPGVQRRTGSRHPASRHR
jgi:hypothetical protein